MNRNFIEIDNELINLNSLSKIKKIKTNDDDYSIIFESDNVVKTIKYKDEDSRNIYYNFLKSRLVERLFFHLIKKISPFLVFLKEGKKMKTEKNSCKDCIYLKDRPKIKMGFCSEKTKLVRYDNICDKFKEKMEELEESYISKTNKKVYSKIIIKDGKKIFFD